MQNTPKGLRLQIGVFGARNAGKSSLLNRLAGQQISIVSDVAGTTTDPIEKAMELVKKYDVKAKKDVLSVDFMPSENLVAEDVWLTGPATFVARIIVDLN